MPVALVPTLHELEVDDEADAQHEEDNDADHDDFVLDDPAGHGPQYLAALADVVIHAAEGVAGLYKGYGVNVIKVAPSSAITFLTYETVRRALDSIATEKG